MANTITITRNPDDSLRVRVNSPGERDLSANMTLDELGAALSAAGLPVTLGNVVYAVGEATSESA